VDEDKPRLVNVVCNLIPPRDGEEGYDCPRVERYLCHPSHTEYKPVDPDVLLPGFPWDNSMLICCRETFAIDGSPINQCVQHLTSGLAPYRWAGPIVVLKQRGYAVQNIETYEDADSSMLGPIIMYFLEYGRK
jgi:hypothetical protein